MTKNPYANVMERAWKKASDKGHELGAWKPREEGQGFVTTCDRCGGKLTVSGESKMVLVSSDPFMGLDFCPGDNSELMKAIDKKMARRLAKCYALLIRKAQEKREGEMP